MRARDRRDLARRDDTGNVSGAGRRTDALRVRRCGSRESLCHCGRRRALSGEGYRASWLEALADRLNSCREEELVDVRALFLGCAASLSLITAAAIAQPFPLRPVRYIMPLPAGSETD